MRTADRIKLVREKGEYPVRKICSSEEAVEYVRMLYKEDISIYESFFIILLNCSNVTIGYQKISQGTTHSTTVDLKFIVHSAIECFADSMIIVHNHPSGNTSPSQHDMKLTKEIKEALGMFNVSILDHIILSESGYYSFADEGDIIWVEKEVIHACR